MPDIFISYARPQEDRAHRTAEVLRRLGYGVWRDDELPAHLPYADVIEERLRASRVVLVLWSAEAVKSQWVRAEADLARQAGTLVQMSLDGSPLPMPFNQIQCADLRGWSGTDDHAGWQKVLGSVRDLIEAPGIAAPTSIPMPRSTAEGRLLAVMAFDNLSNDPEMTYFSDGVSEEILQTIARMPDLKVVGRSSSFQFRGKDKALANVTAQLMTTHVLDGAVRRSGDRVRISASLVECQTQTSVWSGQFDRDLSDVFALQDEIAAAIAEALQLVFAPAAEPRKVDPKAYDYYLRARALAGAWATNAECIALLEQAVALSPDFGAAWASLALARALDARWSKEPGRFTADREVALKAADRAEALDPSLGVSYVARSLLEGSGAYFAREALLQVALEAAPSDPEILKHASDFVGSVGRTRESFRLVARAHGIDPLNKIIANRHAGALAEIGMLLESYEAAEIGRERWPDFDWFIASPLLISATLGDWAIAEPLITLAEADGRGYLQAILGLVNDYRDPTPEAQARMLARGESQLAKGGSAELSQIMFIHRIGLVDEAFDLLARSSFARIFTPEGRPPDSLFLTGIIFGAMGRDLRRDPRFVDLCDKLGICDYWVATGRWPDCEHEVAPHYDLRARSLELVATRGLPDASE